MLPDSSRDSIRVNLGCGLVTPPGWLNVDGSWNARLAKFGFVRRFLARVGMLSAEAARVEWPRNVVYHDVRKRLPWADDSIDALYASHLLEHLYVAHARALLRDVYRVLHPGGFIRIMVPDLEQLAREYLDVIAASPTAPELGSAPADVFMSELRCVRSTLGSALYRIYTAMTEFDTHKWMYDRVSLPVVLSAAGFSDVRVMQKLESRIADIAAVEKNDGLIVEAMKPLDRSLDRRPG